MVAPRFCACTRSSRTSTAAPSPMTKPSRFPSKGRLAPAGSSLRRESARMAANPATASGVTPASLPPQSMTSARPSRIASYPSPIAIADAAQAVQGALSGPRAPSSIEIQPAAMLGMKAVTRLGRTRADAAPAQHRARLSTPPWAVPIDAPTRSGSLATSSAASASAIRAAATASWVKRSVRPSECRSSHWPGSKSTASQAIRTVWSSVANAVIGAHAPSPASRRFHVVSTSAPSGVTAPRPVITTRRSSSLETDMLN